VTDPATITDKTPLEIYLPGVETPDTQGNGAGTSFFWTADNAQSQDVTQGNYYIKVEQTDTYGHVTAFIKEVTVLRQEKYVEMKIFNEAGELVRIIRKDGASTLNDKLNLVVGDGKGTLAIDENGNPVNIKYGSNLLEYITWDGKDSQGKVVQSGSYEIQMIMTTDTGLTVEATQSVIVLREAKKYLDKLIILPNPYDEKKAPGPITFKWTFINGVQTGDAYVRVYNVAGELVASLKGDLAGATGITWNLKQGKVYNVSRGVYIAVLEAKNTAGYLDRVKEKMAIAVYK
jgi:flagellar hook assembly protein FlgD